MGLSSSTLVSGFDLNISRIWAASQVQTLAMMFSSSASSSNHALISTEFSHCSKLKAGGKPSTWFPPNGLVELLLKIHILEKFDFSQFLDHK